MYRYFRLNFSSNIKNKRIIYNFIALIVFLIVVSSFSSNIIDSNNLNNIDNNKPIIDEIPKASAPPTFDIDSPVNYTLYGKLAPNYSLSKIKFGNYTWYEFLGIGVNSTPIELEGTSDESYEGEFDQTMWNSLSNGTATVRFYVNNSVPELEYLDAIIRIDVINPTLIINSPQNLTRWNIPPNIQVTATDPNLHSVWYTVGTTNISLANGVSESLDSSIWTSLPNEGQFTINFFANDSAGNINNTYSFTLYKDVVAPSLSIDSPANNTYWNSIPDIQVTASDTYLDSVWYTVGATKILLTSGVSEPLDSTIWSGLPDEGPFTINFFANDTAANINNTYTLTLYKDVATPSLSITSPANNTYWNSIPDIQVTASDMYLDSVWYTVGATKIMLESGVSEPLNSTIWSGLPDEGPFTINFFANDSVGNINNTHSLTLYKDDVAPSLSIGSPANNTYWNTIPDIQVTMSDMYLDSVWYTVGATKIMLESGVFEPLDSTIWNSLSQGEFQINLFANDSAGNINNTYTLTLYKDIVAPSLSINSPANNTYWNSIPDIQVTASDMYLDSVWYTVGATKIMLESGVSEPLDSTIWSGLPDEGPFTINFFANDSAGNINNTYTLTLYKDVATPSLSITSPANDSYWNSIPDIQVTASDMYLDSVWYTVGATKIMLESGVSEPLDSTIWSSLPDEGQFIINFYANDSVGNINNTYSFTLYKDILAPRLIVNLPINNTYCDAPPLINITAFDMTTLNLLNYRVGLEPQKTLINNTEQALDISIWNNLAQGEFIIYLYAWDYLNNLNDTYILRLYKDTLAPEITINSPEDSTWFNSRPRINITAIDPNLDTLWYRVGTTNITLSSDIEELLNGSIWDGLAEGPFNIEIFANDTFGHFNNSYVLTLYKDITTPSLIIILPINGTIYNSQPSINVTVFDTYLDTLWYRVGNTNITLTNNTEVLLNLTIWDSLPEEGVFIIYFYANDLVGNLNNTLVLTLYKDIKAPTIIIDSPQSNDLFGENSPSVSLNVTDANLDEVWYQLSNGTVTTSNYTWTGFINQTVWNQVGNGNVTIKFYANDTFNHLGFAEVTVRKNTEKPIILVENPLENELFGLIAPNFTIYKSGPGLNTTWYTLDNGLTNFTFSGLNGTIDQDAWDNFGFEIIILRFYVNDSLGKTGFDEITIRKDPDPPEIFITFITPSSNNSYWDEEPTFRITVYEPNIDSIWYRVGATNITFINDTDIVLNDTIWNGLPQGKFIIEVFAVDILGYLNDSITLTFYKDTLAPRLVINQPNDGNYYNTRPPINITVYDPNLDFLIYTVTGHSPSGISLGNNTQDFLNQDIWDNLPEGAFSVEIIAVDTFNHRNDTFILTLYKDTIAPIVVVNLPIDYSYWNTPPIINIAGIDPNLDTLWYRVGTTNITLTNSTDQPLDGGIWDSLTEQSFTLEVFANDSYGNLNNLVTLTLYKDLTAPNININSPNNNTYYGSEPDIFLTATDLSVDSVWYSVGGTIRPLTNGLSEPLDSSIWNSLPQGEFQVFIFANDTAGNLNNTLMLTLLKDTSPPLVTINLPYNNTYWNYWDNIAINVEAFDPNLAEIRYTVSGQSVILVNGSDTIFAWVLWDLLAEGPFIIEIFAEDIFGYTNDSFKLTLYKDTTLPNIDIISPQPNDLFGENTPFVSLNVTDASLENVWYQLRNGTVVTDNYPWTGSIEQSVWDQVGNGTVTIRFYANDTATNINFKDVVVRKNIFAPIITINSPGNNDLFGIAAPDFIIYKSGPTIQSTWYTLNDGITNITFTGLSGTINQTVWDNFDSSVIILRFYINDSFGKIGFDEVSIRKDQDMPIITVNSPNDYTAFASSPFINLTIDEPNLDKVWYRINNSLIFCYCQTDNVTQFFDFIIWNSLPQGDFNVELCANDTMGNINNFITLHLSKDISGPNITINRPIEDDKVGRTAPRFELLISDENGVGSSWYTIGWGGTPKYFTDLNGTIDQSSWEQIWDNSTQGATITIIFYATDALGNPDSLAVNLKVEKPIELPKFLQNPLGILLPSLGLVVMIPLSLRVRKSKYYKSLNNKDKRKLKNVLITAGFFLSLLTLYFVF